LALCRFTAGDDVPKFQPMRNAFKTAVLLGALSGLLLMIGRVLGGQTGLVIALVLALAMNFGSYWFSDRIILRMYRAKSVGPDHPLHRTVARLVERAGLPMPEVYVIPTETPNAFATGRSPTHAAVAATEGILRLLTPEELSGVMAHELAHVQHRDILISSIAATIAAAITMIAHMALWFGGRRGGRDIHPLVAVMMLILAPLAAGIVQAAISRSREFAADARGAQIAGRPDGLASALRRIEGAVRQRPLAPSASAQATEHLFIIRPFSGSGVLKLFSTHPPTDQRIAKLMASTQ